MSGAAVLLPLGAAFGLLAAAMLTVQFLLGLHRRAFVAARLVVAALALLSVAARARSDAAPAAAYS